MEQSYPRLFTTLRFTNAAETRLALVVLFRFLKHFIKNQQEGIRDGIRALSESRMSKDEMRKNL